MYTIGFTPPDAAEYAHIAGRTGRVGQAGRGLVTCVLGSSEQVADLKAIIEGDLKRRLLVSATSEAAVGGAAELAEGEDDWAATIRRLEEGLMLEVDGEGDDGEGE